MVKLTQVHSGIELDEGTKVIRAVVRVQTAVRLQWDLHINLHGVALALDLLEELEALRKTQGSA